MIGYVLDGDVEGAIAAVRAAIANHAPKLALQPDAAVLGTNEVCPGAPALRQTVHERSGERYLVHHLFLPVQS
jgi:hypothetical protein